MDSYHSLYLMIKYLLLHLEAWIVIELVFFEMNILWMYNQHVFGSWELLNWFLIVKIGICI